MTRLYEAGLADHEGFDFRSLLLEGKSALKKQSYDEAIQILFVALQNSTVREGKPGSGDYIDAARAMRDALVRSGHAQEALTLGWYLNEIEPAAWMHDTIRVQDKVRSRLLALEKAEPVERSTEEARNEIASCAHALEGVGLVVRAAVLYEDADAWSEARALWSRLAQSLSREANDHYTAALAHFNLFRASRKLGEERAALRAAADAISLLEEAADRFEGAGVRERAFDCFQVMIEIGREMDVFEHIMLGFSNRLRILREDQLRHFALRTYGEAIEAARAYGERMVAAALAREMASFAQESGEPAQSQRALLLEASLWRELASAAESPAEAEHSLLLALVALGELGQLASMRETYEQLAALDLDPARKDHYSRAARRFGNAPDERVETPIVTKPRRPVRTHAVWHVDLLEWEAQGSASEACADILIDRRAQGEITRRRALAARLVALAEEREREGPMGRRAALALCKTLAPIELYTILAPLERLALDTAPAVRAAVVRSIGKFLFKRTFITIRRALEDPDPSVVSAAIASIQELRFPHAFDPLARIFREAPRREARHAALSALTKIDGAETAELLLEVLSFGLPEERALVIRELRKRRPESFVKLARARSAELNTTAQSSLREIASDELRNEERTALDSGPNDDATSARSTAACRRARAPRRLRSARSWRR